ncbi:MAG: Succinate dehydrogenase iron-sulfur protein [Anaerolineae bacterium]|nr:MAG: Succinate dehydrogenase iron-sulfur protein [Anaerolineae bacterium]
MDIKIRRTNHWQIYSVTLPPSAYILDALEEIHRQDPTLLFRHSCHHGSCGSCGIRINGKEGLACTTQLGDILQKQDVIVIEPLRNFPLIGDLVVDFSPMFAALNQINLPLVQQNNQSPIIDYQRFEDCIECGLCISACPISGSNSRYIGPVSLAAAWRLIKLDQPHLDRSFIEELIDKEDGVWRCHAAFECSEVCPSNVDPAKGIMSLRQFILMQNINPGGRK